MLLTETDQVKFKTENQRGLMPELQSQPDIPSHDIPWNVMFIIRDGLLTVVALTTMNWP